MSARRRFRDPGPGFRAAIADLVLLWLVLMWTIWITAPWPTWAAVAAGGVVGFLLGRHP